MYKIHSIYDWNKFSYTCTNNFKFSNMGLNTMLEVSWLTKFSMGYRMIYQFVVAQEFIISTCLGFVHITDFVNFLKNYNRYKIEIFRVNLFFKGLWKDISFIFLA